MRFSDSVRPERHAHRAASTRLPAYRAEGAGHIFAYRLVGRGNVDGSSPRYAQSHAHHDHDLLLYQGEGWRTPNILHSGTATRKSCTTRAHLSGGDVVCMIEGSPPAELIALGRCRGVLLPSTARLFTAGRRRSTPICASSCDRPTCWSCVTRTTSEAVASRIYQLNTPLPAQVSGRRVHT
jgi:hypothetical protein